MSLRIATHNLLHGIRLTDGTVDHAALREECGELGAHVLAVQEVDQGQPRSGHSAQTSMIAAGASAPWWQYAATVTGTPGARADWAPAAHPLAEPGEQVGGVPQYGIGLVSTLPVLQWRLLRLRASPVGLPMPLPDPAGRAKLRYIADEPRAALAAVIEVAPGRVMSVISTHLSFVPAWNLWQLHRLRRWARSLPRPLVLAGDLNLPGALPSRVLGWTRLVTGPTYPSPGPRVQLDHLLADHGSNLRLLAAGTRRTAISDHLAAWADVEVDGTAVTNAAQQAPI